MIIAFAFVSVDSCFRRAPSQETAGKLDGQRISYDQFEDVANAVRGFGDNRDNQTPYNVVARRAWEQLAALQTLQQSGLVVSPEEVRHALQSEPQFQGPNGFDINLYRLTLARQGLTPEMFERFVTRQLGLMKSAVLLNAATWVAPMELEDELSAMTDSFTVQTATISNEFAAAELPITDEMLRKYYDEHKASFALPDRLAVRYIAYPVTNYLQYVTVLEDDMRDFYDGNISDYTQTDTNNVSTVTPFEEVKDAIQAELQMIDAQHIAHTSVVFNVFGQLTEKENNSIEMAAQEAGLPIQTSPLFDAGARLTWVEKPQEFLARAFELDPADADSKYNVADGETVIYLMELAEFSEAHTPTYEAVLEQMRPQVLAQARAEAFDKKVAALRAALAQQMTDGKDFAAAATAMDLNVSTSLTYTVNTIQASSFPNNYSIAYGARSLQPGETSEAIPVANSEALLVHVLAREPGDALAAEMMRAQISSSLAQRRNVDLFGAWLEWNLQQKNFVPTHELIDEDEPLVFEDPDAED